MESDCFSAQDRTGGCSAQARPSASFPLLPMTQLGVCPVRHFFISTHLDSVSKSLTEQPEDRAGSGVNTPTIITWPVASGCLHIPTFTLTDRMITQDHPKWPRRSLYPPCAKSPGMGRHSATAEQPDKSHPPPLPAGREGRGTRAISHRAPDKSS